MLVPSMRCAGVPKQIVPAGKAAQVDERWPHPVLRECHRSAGESVPDEFKDPAGRRQRLFQKHPAKKGVKEARLDYIREAVRLQDVQRRTGGASHF